MNKIIASLMIFLICFGGYAETITTRWTTTHTRTREEEYTVRVKHTETRVWYDNDGRHTETYTYYTTETRTRTVSESYDRDHSETTTIPTEEINETVNDIDDTVEDLNLDDVETSPTAQLDNIPSTVTDPTTGSSYTGDTYQGDSNTASTESDNALNGSGSNPGAYAQEVNGETNNQEAVENNTEVVTGTNNASKNYSEAVNDGNNTENDVSAAADTISDAASDEEGASNVVVNEAKPEENKAAESSTRYKSQEEEDRINRKLLSLEQEEHSNSGGAQCIQDPANIVTGSNEFGSIDFTYNSFGNNIKVKRHYVSNNDSNLSFGKGWVFNYDARILYGVKKGYQESLDSAQKTLDDTNISYNKLFNDVDGYYHNAKTLAQSSIDKSAIAVTNATLAKNNAVEELAKAKLAYDQSKEAKDWVDPVSKKTAVELIGVSINDTLAAYNNAVTAVAKAQKAVNDAVSARSRYAADRTAANNLKNSLGRPVSPGESLANYKSSPAPAGDTLIYKLELALDELDAAQVKINTADASVKKLERNSKTKNKSSVKSAREKVNAAQNKVNLQRPIIESRLATCKTDYANAVTKYNAANSNWNTANNICKAGGTGVVKLNSAVAYRNSLYKKLYGDANDPAFKSLYTKQAEIVAAHESAVTAFNAAAAYYIVDYTEPAEGADPSSYTHTANGRLVYAERTFADAIQRNTDSIAYKTNLEAEEAARKAEVLALIANLESEVARQTREKNLAVSNESRNLHNIDPSNPNDQYVKNNQVKVFNERGIGTLYEIIAEPDFNSTSKHSDGTINYYPNGSELKRITYDNGNKILDDLGASGEKLTLNSDGAITVINKDKSQVIYNDTGRLSKLVDKNGNTVNFEFSGRSLDKIIDQAGNETIFEYTGHKISKFTDSIGRVYTYSYSGDYLTGYTDPEGNSYGYSYENGLMTQKTSPDSGVTTFEYTITADGRTLFTKAIDSLGNNWATDYHPEDNYTIGKDRDGHETYYFYDDNKKTVEERFCDGTSLLKEYDIKGNLIKETNRGGYSTYYSYDEHKNLTEITTPAGTNIQSTYDLNNNLTGVTGFMGNRTTFDYDIKGNIVRKNYPGGSYEEFIYNGNGTMKTSRDRNGNITSYEYDLNGNLSKVTNSDGSSYSLVANPFGLVDKVVDENGGETLISYDKLDNVTSVTDALGNLIRKEYNGSGKVVKVIDALNNYKLFNYNTNKKIASEVDALGNKKEYNYTPEGDVSTVTLPDGSAVNYTYDLDGRILSSTEVISNIAQIFEYDALGNMVGKTDANGNKWTYVYDELSRLTKVTDPLGNVTKSYYDKNSNLTEVVDANGNSTTYNYDDMNRMVSVVDALNSMTQFDYDNNGNLVSKTDAKGNVTTYSYDSRNRLVKTVDPNGCEQKYEYDGKSNLIQSIDSLGNSTSYEYDKLGRAIKITNSLGGSKSFTYDGNGNLLTLTNENGAVVSYVYDALNRVVTSTDPDGNTTNFEYNYQGKVTKVTDTLNNVKTFEYDTLGRLIVSKDEVGATKTYTYDKNGNLLSYIDALDNETTFSYDKLGRRLNKSNPMGETESFVYDALGNLTQVTDAEGYKFAYEYNEVNRLIKEVNQAGNVQEFGYNSLNQLTSKLDFNGNRFTFQYDQVGRLLKELLPNGKSKEFTYDKMGNIIKAHDSNSSFEYKYDALNRLVNVKDNNLLEEISYTYDAAGNRTNINWLNSTRDIKYTYGNRNEVLSVTDDERKKTTFEYDALGREVVRNLPNYTKIFKDYDATGRLISVKNLDRRENVLGAEAYFYNFAGQRISDVNEMGQVKTYKYDDAGRLIEALYPLNSGKKNQVFVERISNGLYPSYIGASTVNSDKLGIIDSTTDIQSLVNTWMDVIELEAVINGDRNNWKTDHDNTGLPYHTNLNLPTGLLVEVSMEFEDIQKDGSFIDSNQASWVEKFTYDRNSNLTNKANGWGSINYTYNATNSILTAGNRSFSYDNNGNLLTESLNGVDTSYKYNVNNRVVDVFTEGSKFNGLESNPGNWGVEYNYDVFGRRNSRVEYTGEADKNYLVESNSQTFYDGFGIDPLADFIDNSLIYGDSSYYAGIKPNIEYVRANGNVISTGEFTTTSSRPRISKREYLHQDILGSTMMVTTRNGGVSARYNYDAFGNTHEGSFVGNNNKLGYNGKMYDPVSGIYNYGFRDYSARLARFTTIDPIRDGNNWYAYCNNDPINFIDPFGLDTILIVNYDPTPGDDKIAKNSGFVGHTKTITLDENGNVVGVQGFNSNRSNQISKGVSVPGGYDTDTNVSNATNTYPIDVTPEERAAYEKVWEERKKSQPPLTYNLLGSAKGDGSLMCTEAVVTALNDSGVLDSEESAIINAPYKDWSSVLPSNPPVSYEPLVKYLNNNKVTNPNPNEMETRVEQLNDLAAKRQQQNSTQTSGSCP